MAPIALLDIPKGAESPGMIDSQSDDEDENLIDPIAVIGLSVKFPQEASSLSGFWKLMAEGRSAMTDVPQDRYNIDGFYHPTKRDALPVRGGHFIAGDLAAFDADFFGINPSEAVAMDPAQKLLLETAYRAFENAGIRLEDLKGSNTSVHTGCFTNDYLHLLIKDSARLPTYAAIGATLSMLANRLSWFFDLSGPSVNLDSACSSSAMAIDQACQMLRLGEVEMGVVAGCNLTFDPDYTNVLTNMQFLSHESLSYSFDHRANGYSRGEGIGVVLLKPLSAALRDGNTVRAVIRASGSNQDGRTPGITKPNSKAQIQLIRDTYRKAGLSLKHTRFFEAHGTGTPVGDPAEANTIVKVFEKVRCADDPIFVGAVKSNIGHLEGAAGVAGLIKTVLVLEKGIIVPNANFEKTNPMIDPVESCLAFPTKCVPWPRNASVIRRASINCFGYGGSNCHIIVDDAHSYLSRRRLRGCHFTLPDTLDPTKCIGSTESPASSETSESSPDEQLLKNPRLLVWSAASESALRSMIHSWQEYCRDKHINLHGHPSIDDLAYTLDTHRSQLPWRSYAIIHSVHELNDISTSFAEPRPVRSSAPRLAFVFTGQGAQWYAMGRELFQYESFRQTIEEAEAALSWYGCSWSVREELLKSESESRINDPDLAQPLCTILQIGLVDLLRQAGIIPYAVIGHSMGEIAASYCAGAISRQSAFKLSFYRGLFVAKVPERSPWKGGMLAVGLSSTAIQPYFDRIRQSNPGFNLMVSCINSSTNITVSGEVSQLVRLEADLRRESIFARRLRVSAAYHSPQLESIVDDCVRCFSKLQAGNPESEIAMISSVTASRISHQELLQPRYWVNNMVLPVNFLGAVTRLCSQSTRDLSKKIDGSHRNAIVVDELIEIGPHAALGLPIKEIFSSLPRCSQLSYTSALYRKKSATQTLLQLLGDLFSGGYSVNIRSINGVEPSLRGSQMSLADAPEYPFTHNKAHWHESNLSREYRFRLSRPMPLLGTQTIDCNPIEPQWRHILRLNEYPWLEDHRMGESIVYPASALLSMAISAASQMADPSREVVAFKLRQVEIHSALMISINSEAETRLSFRQPRPRPESQLGISDWEFSISSLDDGGWSELCDGHIQIEYTQDHASHSDILSYHRKRLASAMEKRNNLISGDDFYQSLQQRGFFYGPYFRGIKHACYDGYASATGTIEFSHPLKADRDALDYVIHPATLDTALHLSLVALTRGLTREVTLQVPTSLEELWISAKWQLSNKAELKALTSIDTEHPKFTLSSMVALDHEEQSMRLALRGLKTSVITDYRTGNEPTNNPANQIFSCSLIVDVEVLTRKEINKWLDEECGEDLTGPQEFCRDLRQYLLLVLQDIRSSFSTDEQTSLGQPHLSRYLKWIDWQLDMNSPLEVDRPLPELVAKINSQGHIGQFFLEVAENLKAVLSGATDALQLLFENNNAKRFYEEQTMGSLYYSKIERFASQLSLKHPSMDILEIGAGTGSFTRHMLQAFHSHDDRIPKYGQYVFTDVSSTFLENAKSEFGRDHSNMVFKTLDVEKDLILQGYKEASFDLVVASNVLHVAKNISKVLSSIRKLLRVGGKLILHETTNPKSLETGFVFGLLPGWWAGEEECRLMSATLTEDHWVDLLTNCSFSTPNFILRDYADDTSSLMSIICATAIGSGVQLQDNANFCILAEPSSPAQQMIASSLQTIISQETAANICVNSLSDSFFKETQPELTICLLEIGAPFLLEQTEQTFAALQEITLSAKQVLWVTDGGSRISDPAFGMINGFAKVLRIECPTVKISTLALEGFDPEIKAQKIHRVVHQILMLSDPLSLEDYWMIHGKLHFKRGNEYTALIRHITEATSGFSVGLRTLEKARPFHAQYTPSVETTSPLLVVEDLPLASLKESEVEIEVHAFGLNGQNAISNQGTMSEPSLCSQGAGIIKMVRDNCQFQPGDRVCFHKHCTLSSTVRAEVSMVARLPDNISFVEAATLPTLSLFAADLFTNTLRLGPDSVVLLHYQDTPSARAVLNYAMRSPSHVFVTVSNLEQKENLEKVITENTHILIRAGYLEHFRCLKGEGADVVVDLSDHGNCLDTFACLAPLGQAICVETPTQDPCTRLQPLHLPSNVSYVNITVDAMLNRTSKSSSLSLQAALGPFIPLSPHNGKQFECSEIKKAFESLEEHYHSEVVLNLTSTDRISLVTPFCPKGQFDPYASYVIAGGFGDLGRCLARWMVRRGARNLIILSRSGCTTEKAENLVEELKSQDVRICAPPCDISEYLSLRHALMECETMPLVRGCIQASGALKDTMFAQMTLEDWNVAIRPKVKGSWNLHQLLPFGMDFFIMTSSITGIIGQATQINYAAGNSYQDALANYRIASGEKATSLDLGVLLTGGMIAENPGLMGRLLKSGYHLPLSESHVLAVMDYFCNPSLTLEDLLSAQAIIGIRSPADCTRRGIPLLDEMQRPFWSLLCSSTRHETEATITKDSTNVRTLLQAAESDVEAGNIVAKSLTQRFANLLLIPDETINIEAPFHIHGADSLSAIELRNWILKVFAIDVPVFDILGNATISETGLAIARRWRLKIEDEGGA